LSGGRGYSVTEKQENESEAQKKSMRFRSKVGGVQKKKRKRTMFGAQRAEPGRWSMGEKTTPKRRDYTGPGFYNGIEGVRGSARKNNKRGSDGNRSPRPRGRTKRGYLSQKRMGILKIIKYTTEEGVHKKTV